MVKCILNIDGEKKKTLASFKFACIFPLCMKPYIVRLQKVSINCNETEQIPCKIQIDLKLVQE